MSQSYKLHPPIPTVSDNDSLQYLSPQQKQEQEDKNLKPMDICYCNNHPYIGIGVVLMGPLNIPYFEDGCASDYSYQPLDIQNPQEWSSTYSAYIVFDLTQQKHVICAANSLKKLEEHPHDGYIPFDHATSKMRCNLGLIELANKWWKKS